MMGSASDMAHCEKIKQACRSSGVPCELRVSSAHKGTDETLKILAEYEGMFCLNWCVVSNGKVRDASWSSVLTLKRGLKQNSILLNLFTKRNYLY